MRELFLNRNSLLRLMFLRKCKSAHAAVTKVVSGALLHITDALVRNAKKLVLDIEPVQSGSGDPAIDNIRPISGWTGCNIVKTGKNLRVSNTSGTYTSRGITFTYNSDGTYSVIGGTPTGVVLADSNRNDELAIVLPAGTYTASCNSDFENVYLWVYNRTQGQAICTNQNALTTVTFTLAEESKISSTLTALTGAVIGNGTNYLQIEAGSTATAFEPHQTTYPITFPSEVGTVYGGELDVTTGILKIYSILYTFDGTEDWGTISASSGGEKYYILNTSDENIGAGRDYELCSHYPVVSVSSSNTIVGIRAFWTDSSGGNFRVGLRPYSELGITTADGLKSYLAEQHTAGTPVQLYVRTNDEHSTYYHLTPVQIRLFLGENSLWSDTNGEMELTYLAESEESEP